MSGKKTAGRQRADGHKAKARRPRGSLNREAILGVARRLLREKGLEALSIRNIAAELDAGTMSIYSHYTGKPALVADLVDDFVARAHRQQHDAADWRTWLEWRFADIYRATTGEPEFLTLMLEAGNIGESARQIFAETVQQLEASGFDSERAMVIFHRLLAFTLGSAMLHIGQRSRPAVQLKSDRVGQVESAQERPAAARSLRWLVSQDQFHRSLAGMIDEIANAGTR